MFILSMSLISKAFALDSIFDRDSLSRKEFRDLPVVLNIASADRGFRYQHHTRIGDELRSGAIA